MQINLVIIDGVIGIASWAAEWRVGGECGAQVGRYVPIVNATGDCSRLVCAIIFTTTCQSVEVGQHVRRGH